MKRTVGFAYFKKKSPFVGLGGGGENYDLSM